MTDPMPDNAPCERLSDRMAAVASGRASWTAADEAHLAACADCAAEWRLLAAARRAGDAYTGPADPAAIAAGALARLRAARRAARRRGWLAGAGALAAAAALVLAVLPQGGDAPPAAAATATLDLALPELEGADSADLAAALASLRAQGAADQAVSTLETPRLYDLDPADLTLALDALEG